MNVRISVRRVTSQYRPLAIRIGLVIGLLLEAQDRTPRADPPATPRQEIRHTHLCHDTSRPISDTTPRGNATFDGRPDLVYPLTRGGRRMRTALPRASLTTVDGTDVAVSIDATAARAHATSSRVMPVVALQRAIGAPSP